MSTKEYPTCSMAELKGMARRHNNHYFERDTMRYFNSRICSTVIRNCNDPPRPCGI